MEWVFLQETDSTNRVAKELARQGATHGTAVLAERQTAGRGRMERSFFSPEGGMYLSAILRPEIPPEDLLLMTPMAAAAVWKAVERLTGICLGIKWVNDLYLEGKKVCGILCERTGDAVIVGVGLNLKTPEGGFPPELNAGALDVGWRPHTMAHLVMEELLIPGTSEPPDPTEPFTLTVTRSNGNEQFIGCRFTSQQRQDTIRGVTQIRKGTAEKRNVMGIL